MKNNVHDRNEFIHKSYKRSRLLILLVLIFSLLFITVAYSADLSSVLHMLGYVNLDVEEGNIEITSIDESSATNATNNGYTMSISDGDEEGITVLVAEFDIDYYREFGSSTMNITYDLVIENNTFRTQTLSTINSTPTFTSGESTLSYSLDGANVGTTVLKPGESITVTLTFSLGSGERNTHYIVNEIFEFEFLGNSSKNDIGLTPFLDTVSTTFNTNDELREVQIYLASKSTSVITYNITTSNSNFEFVDSEGNDITSLTIQPETTETISIYLKIAENHIFLDSMESVDVSLTTTGPSILTYNLGKIATTVPLGGAYQILKDKTIYSDSTIDFTSTATTSGVFKNSTGGENTYFYRGNVSDNYVLFAGFYWRVIRIDKYGTRIILDSVISETSAWASTNTTVNQDLKEAIVLLKYSNSLVKPILTTWYDEHLTTYADIIKKSLFCEDMSYQSMTSTGSGYPTYYFGAYLRTGSDSDDYTPEFVCDASYITSYDIGLISGDEVAFAGGLFKNSSTNYYLYNSDIDSIWWTISPSYYDTTLKTVGIMIVGGSDGKFDDWQNGSTIANTNAIRPVITLDTDRLSGGTGIYGDPYVFS